MSIEERNEERAQSTFDISKMIRFLDDNPEETNRLMLQLERDPIFKHNHDLNWQQERALCFERVRKIVPYLELDTEETFAKRISLLSILDGSTATRIGVHYGLFIQTVRALGTSQQFQHWAITKGAARMNNFFGCFAMTELAHGSNVAKLQTTATFNSDIDGFIVNTPNLGATKWWIGGASHSATHAVVYARLIVAGKDYGVKSFVVQLRDVTTHQLLPGVAVGDIGRKMGRDGVDNGYIQFTSVQTPRSNMLSKHTKVDEDGNVTQPKFEQLGYTALVIARVSMVNDSFNVAKRFITIALRFATSRRQFGHDIGGLEKKIIDYPHHRRRLFPLLATVYALNSSSREVSNFNNKIQELVRDRNINLDEVVPDLKDLFCLTAGMKAFATWETCKIIDESRQSCGGHGYSAYNGFGKGYNDWVVQCTWEGDNNVLCLSCGRALIHNYLNFLKGDKVGYYSQFILNNYDGFRLSNSNIDDIKCIVKAWELVTKKLVEKGAGKFNRFSQEMDIETSFEKISSNRFEIAKAFTYLTILKTFEKRVASESPKELENVLSSLVILFAYSITSQNLALFYSSGIIVESNFNETLNLRIDEINKKLRPEIIGLTDAFNLSDFFINSPIGNSKGDIYESYFDTVNSAVDNSKMPHYYHNIYKPFLQRQIKSNDNEDNEHNDTDDD